MSDPSSQIQTLELDMLGCLGASVLWPFLLGLGWLLWHMAVPRPHEAPGAPSLALAAQWAPIQHTFWLLRTLTAI